MSHRKGFTLIELLIVIAILAILAAAVIVVLNPAQLLAQARDGTRLSDLNSIKSAIALYLTDVSPVSFSSTGPLATVNATCGFGTCTVDSDRTTDGSGWVGVNLSAITGGSPLPTLPVDPTNSATYQYAYKASSSALTFELNSRLESQKHRDKMKTDGGDDSACTANGYIGEDCYYEVGTASGLNL